MSSNLIIPALRKGKRYIALVVGVVVGVCEARDSIIMKWDVGMKTNWDQQQADVGWDGKASDFVELECQVSVIQLQCKSV